MHLRKISMIRGIIQAGVVLALLAVAAAAAPARAAGDEDFKGWFVTLDAALTQPNGLEQQYAYNHTFPAAGTVNTKRLIFDNSSDFTGAIKFGYGFGGGLGRLQISYWGFDNEDTENKTVTGELIPTVFGNGYYGMSIYDGGSGIGVQAKSKVKAGTYDIDYLRSYGVGKKTTVTWLAGLRSATWEETQDVVADNIEYGYTYQQHKHFKADGFGLRLGAAVNFGFTEHFGMEGSTAFSFLQAKSDGDAFQQFANGNLETITAKDDHIRGEIREYDLKAVWNYGMMDYFIGYRMESWDGLVTDPVLETGFNSSLQGRDTMSFNSLHAGVTFKFGQK